MLRPAALLALLVPAAAGAAHGRLQLSLYAGGGLASDLFVGAGLGRDGILELQPEARLDLSLSPRWKLGTRLSGGYASFPRSGFSAASGALESQLRWLGEGREGALALAAEQVAYSTGAPLDPAVPSSPTVTRSSALRLTPLLRWQGWGAQWRVAAPLAYQSSSAAGEDVAERDAALLAGAALQLGPWALAASYRLQRAVSDRPDFTATSHGLFASAGRLAGPVELEGQVQGIWLHTGAGTAEQLLRAGLSAAWPMVHGLWLEAVYGFAGAWSDAPGEGFSSRHQVTLGLRGKVEAVSW